MHLSTPYGSWDRFLAWAGNTDIGVPGKQKNLQYVQIVSNNIYAKFGAAMANIMEAIWKKYNFIENRLATLVSRLLGNEDALSVILCRIMFMPSLAQLGLIEWKQFEQTIF